MIIGSHETFIGTKVDSVISSEDFSHYRFDDPIFVPSLYSFDLSFETTAQAP